MTAWGYIATAIGRPLRVCVSYDFPSNLAYLAAYIQDECYDIKKGDDKWNYPTGAAKAAVYLVEWGNVLVYGPLFLFSMLSFIKTDNRIMQKLYYRVIAWSIPLSWVFVFTLLIVSIVAIS